MMRRRDAMSQSIRTGIQVAQQLEGQSSVGFNDRRQFINPAIGVVALPANSASAAGKTGSCTFGRWSVRQLSPSIEARIPDQSIIVTPGCLRRQSKEANPVLQAAIDAVLRIPNDVFGGR